MALNYTYEDLAFKSDDYIRKSDLNRKYRNLVDNDMSIFPRGHIPTIWECRWYNNKNIQGYSKGDSVWVNTEPEEEFIVNHAAEIYNYARNNPILVNHIVEFDPMDPKVYSLYRDIVRGFTDKSTGLTLPPLYFIGDIKKPVQIRICTSEIPVTTTPDDDGTWMDFFIKSDENEELLSNTYMRIIDEQFDNHLSGYHSTETFSEISGIYMTNRLTNIQESAFQKYNKGITRPKTMSGFDFIKFSSSKVYGNGATRWFRLWNSGYLEHGGTVNVDHFTQSEENAYGDTCVRVHLDWEYEDGRTSPIYEFHGLGVDTVYPDNPCIIDAWNIYEDAGNISPDNRYSVQVTPIGDEDFRFGDEGNMTVNTLNNDSFTFTRLEGVKKYSFSCGGFTTTAVGTTRGHSFPDVMASINDQDHSGYNSTIYLARWKSDIQSMDDLQSIVVGYGSVVDLNEYLMGGHDYIFVGWYYDGGTWKNKVPMVYDSSLGRRVCNVVASRGRSVYHARYVKPTELDVFFKGGEETSFSFISNKAKVKGGIIEGETVYIDPGEGHV